MKKSIVIFGIGWEQEPMLEKLQNLGLNLIGIHYNDNYVKSVIFEEVFICNLWDVKEVFNFLERKTFDFVISDQDDYGHFLQALASEKYNLPGPKIAQAHISLNKFIQRLKCLEMKILIPEFKLVTSPNDIKQFALSSGFPVILKPIDNRGSIGVIKIIDENEIFISFERACSNSNSHLLIVEKYIEGFEVTVDGFCFPKPKSLAIAEKVKVDNIRQVSIDIKYPAELPQELYERILNNNEKVAKALGFNFGFLHGEYIITKNNEIYLIELANRGGGCFTSEIILPNVSGLPVLDMYIDACLNNKSNIINQKVEKNEVLLKFFNFENGEVEKICGLDKILNSKNVLKYHFYIKEGGIIDDVSSDANRHGFLIVKTSDNLGVRKYAENLIKNIYIKYKN